MAPDALETARARYAAAYQAYREAAKRVSEKFASGSFPSVEELENEAKTIERLAIARREVLDAITRLAPPH